MTTTHLLTHDSVGHVIDVLAPLCSSMTRSSDPDATISLPVSRAGVTTTHVYTNGDNASSPVTCTGELSDTVRSGNRTYGSDE